MEPKCDAMALGGNGAAANRSSEGPPPIYPKPQQDVSALYRRGAERYLRIRSPLSHRCRTAASGAQPHASPILS